MHKNLSVLENHYGVKAQREIQENVMTLTSKTRVANQAD